MAAPALPLPPPHLAARVGPGVGDDPLERYLREGRAVRDRLEVVLGEGWSWSGKRVLDFGCGSARVLRHLVGTTADAELHGCDIDAPSIDWVRRSLPVHAFVNALDPPLPVADGTYDLIYATSVFTHIPSWAAWLCEMHRVLRPGGLLVATVLGEGIWEAFLREPYVEDELGVVVRKAWVDGGAGSEVLQSRWWLEEHWGRAFALEERLDPPRLPDGSAAVEHSFLRLRRRDDLVPTPAALEAIRPGEPRELAGLRTALRIAKQEQLELAASRTVASVVRERAAEGLRASPLAGPLRAARHRFAR